MPMVDVRFKPDAGSGSRATMSSTSSRPEVSSVTRPRSLYGPRLSSPLRLGWRTVLEKRRLFPVRLTSSICLVAAIALMGGLVSCSGANHVAHGKEPVVRYVYIRDQPGENPFGYNPKTLVISVGSRVVWRNLTSQPHTVTATGEHPLFNSGVKKLIAPKHQWSFVYRRVGRYSYYCVVHPYMTGKVIVRPAT
jgi:plastocyanin